MADKKASLILSLEDFVSKGIGSIAAQLAILKQGASAVTAVFSYLTGILKANLDAYGEQETAISKLNQALKNQGIESKAVTQDLVDFSEQLQKNSVYADEVILGAMALGTTFGLTGDRLKQTTQAALDMSTALNIDLKTTMLLLGKAAVGETGTLSRYGIIIADNVPKAEKFSAALEQVNKRFGGSAAAQMATYQGMSAALKNTFGELAETIGGKLAPAAKILATQLNAIATALNDTLKGQDESVVIRNKVVAGLRLERQEIANNIDRLNSYNKYHQFEAVLIDGKIKKGKEAVDGVNAEIAAENERIRILDARIKAIYKEAEAEKAKALAKGKGPTQKEVVEEDKELEKLVEKAQSQIDTANLTELELQNIRTNAMAQELMAKGEHTLAIQLLEQQQTENAKKQNEQRAKNLSSSLQFIASMSNSHNKTLASIGKAAAISTATIDTYAAANKALASAPPPWNFALAALVTTAGLANVAQIGGIKLAEGGMVMPSSGGTMATMGEAGKPEVAIPLDDDRTKDKLRDVLGGGSTIVINAGAVIADEYSLNEFVERIDEKLYERQRNKRSYT